MFWAKTADFISDRSWPILHQKMVFKSRGQNTTWLYTDDVNYVILVASWIIQTKQLWRRVRKHRKRREEEGDIALLEPQTIWSVCESSMGARLNETKNNLYIYIIIFYFLSWFCFFWVALFNAGYFRIAWHPSTMLSYDRVNKTRGATKMTSLDPVSCNLLTIFWCKIGQLQSLIKSAVFTQNISNFGIENFKW